MDDIYKKLVYWELEIGKSESPECGKVFKSQKQEANTDFSNYFEKLCNWLNPKSGRCTVMIMIF